jgi:hypothetical protein
MRPAIKIMRPKKFVRTLLEFNIAFRPSRKVMGLIPLACKLGIVQLAKKEKFDVKACGWSKVP